MGITVADATLVLAVITAGSFIGTSLLNAITNKKERHRRLIEKKLDEFYFPVISLMETEPDWFYDNLDSVIGRLSKVVLTKSYLMQLDSPQTVGKPEPINRRKLMSFVIEEAGNMRFDPPSVSPKKEWEQFYSMILDDALQLTREYYRLSGEKYEGKTVRFDLGSNEGKEQTL